MSIQTSSDGNYFSRIPISIFLADSYHTALCWNNSLELLLIMRGTMKVQINEEYYSMTEGQIILINPRTLHAYSADQCTHILCQFRLQELPFLKEHAETEFLVNSVQYPHPSKYERLKSLIAKLVKVQDQNDANCGTMSVVYDIVSELMMRFSVSDNRSVSQDTIYNRRTRSILDYIIEHYNEGLTLHSVAEAQFLSIPYLSSFFKKNIGVTFSDYYNNLRLQYAVNDLLTSDLTIDDIAHRNGFPDSRTFLRLFKKTYQMRPSVFRKQHHCDTSLRASQPETSLFYPSIGRNAYLPLINRFLNPGNMATDTLSNGFTQIRCDDIHYSEEGVPLRHTFQKICSISSAKALLYNDIQDCLRSVQSAIKFEYISFYGLLNIDPYLYSEKPDGTPVFTFVLVDKIFDFLLSIDLKPLVNFSYMPYMLGEKKPQPNHNYLFHTIPPKDMDRWKLLVTSLTEHLVSRYGEDIVSGWLFNIWKKPDINLFSVGEEQFFELFQATYSAVKQVSPHFQFGTPALVYNSPKTKAWDSRFLGFCRANHCVPDFLCFAFYNDIFPTDSSHDLYLSPNTFLNKNPDSYSCFLDEVESFLQDKQLTGLPVHMLQWNLTVSQRNLINDTCFSSCYTAKNLLENYDRLDSFCYWTISDFSEETELPADLFFGGFGMFTHNGIKKPPYYVFRFASMLGNERIGHGRGWFATRQSSSKKIIIFFYNYEHYSDPFADNKHDDMTLTNRYTPFLQQKITRFSLKLDEIDADYCYIKEYFVNRENCSCYDKWCKMGGLPPQEDELNILKSEQPGLLIRNEKINNGILHIEADLQPLEIRLIEIKLHR